MEKSNISYKLFLWALLPMLCFTIAIYGVKWYCDTVIPPEYQKYFSSEYYSSSLVMRINSKIELPSSCANFLSSQNATGVWDATTSFPMLASLDSTTHVESANNPNQSFYKAGRVYIFSNNQNKWVYYRDKGHWVLKPFNDGLYPKFPKTIVTISWILAFGICLISIIIYALESSNSMTFEDKFPCIVQIICLFITGIVFFKWITTGDITNGINYANYPIWILITFLISEFCTLSTAYSIFLKNTDESNKNALKPSTPQQQQYSSNDNNTDLDEDDIDNDIYGKYIPTDCDKKGDINITTIIVNNGWLLIEENKTWKKFSAQITDSNDIFATNDNECFVIQCRYLEHGDKWDLTCVYQLSYNGIDFTKDGKSLSQLQQELKKEEERHQQECTKYSLKNNLIETLSKGNLLDKFFNFVSRNKIKEKKTSRISQLFDEAYDEKGLRAEKDIREYIVTKLNSNTNNNKNQ